MKIIISPAKVQNGSNHLDLPMTDLLYKDKSDYLRSVLNDMSSDEIAKLMKIKNKLLDETLYNLRSNQHVQHAITLYNGIVFKEINTNLYQPLQIDYMQKHLRILSAMYGLLRPLDGIRPYRLAMTMKAQKINLYEYWNITERFDDPIVNLASVEFSSMVRKPLINIYFKEYVNDVLKIVTVRAKKARGLMVDYMISHMIEDVEDLKHFTEDGYQYSPSLSDEMNWVFLKEQV